MNNHSEALVHALKVLAYIVGSAVVPALISLYSQNANWMALTPVINFVASYLVKWSGLQAAGSSPKG